jgi:hypothetical protein
MNAALARSASSSRHCGRSEAPTETRAPDGRRTGPASHGGRFAYFQELLAGRFRPTKNRRNEDETGSNRSNRQRQGMFMQRCGSRHSVAAGQVVEGAKIRSRYSTRLPHAVRRRHRRIEHSRSKSPTPATPKRALQRVHALAVSDRRPYPFRRRRHIDVANPVGPV